MTKKDRLETGPGDEKEEEEEADVLLFFFPSKSNDTGFGLIGVQSASPLALLGVSLQGPLSPFPKNKSKNQNNRKK